MRIYSIAEETTVDGPGLRTSIYLQGCPIHCKNCHNKGSWDPNGGYEMNDEEIISKLKEDPFITGVSVLGGEPFFQKESLLRFLKKLKKELPSFSIWVYTGYTLESLKKDKIALRILKLIDVLVDGPFIESKNDSSCIFRGSSNQRIIKNPASYEE